MWQGAPTLPPGLPVKPDTPDQCAEPEVVAADDAAGHSGLAAFVDSLGPGRE